MDKQDENCFELQFSLVDYLRPIHTFQFFTRRIRMRRASTRQRKEMGHDTGYYGRKSLLERKGLTGFGLCALQFSGCGADHLSHPHRSIMETICEMEGCRLERYTDGSRRNSQETVLHLSCGARMENVKPEKRGFCAAEIPDDRVPGSGAGKGCGGNRAQYVCPALHAACLPLVFLVLLLSEL